MTCAFRRAVGPVVLVPRGAELPYPSDGGFKQREDFKAPQAVRAGAEGEIRVQILAGDEHRSLFEEIWKIKGPVKKGAPLLLEFRSTRTKCWSCGWGCLGLTAHLKQRSKTL